MDNEKTRKVRLSDIIDQSIKVSDAAAKAMNGDKMMRQYDKMMMTAGGGHLAAYGAVHEAAFSEARRIAELARPIVPDFTRQLAEISTAGRRLTDAALASARFSQIDAGMELLRKQMEVTVHAAAALPLSLTRHGFSSIQSELNKALDCSRILEAARLERMIHLQETIYSSFTARAASMPELRDRPMPILPPRIKQSERVNVAAQFLNSFKHEYDEAVKEAEEEGGQVIVTSSTPSGDPIRVAQLSSVGDHFVLVHGFDQHKRPRRFKANCAAVELTIEIVPIDEDLEEDNREDEDLIN